MGLSIRYKKYWHFASDDNCPNWSKSNCNSIDHDEMNYAPFVGKYDRAVSNQIMTFCCEMTDLLVLNQDEIEQYGKEICQSVL